MALNKQFSTPTVCSELRDEAIWKHCQFALLYFRSKIIFTELVNLLLQRVKILEGDRQNNVLKVGF